MTTTARQPLMLMPKPGLYPVDADIAELAEALKARNWQVPGLKVTFRTYGSGDAMHRIIDEISGHHFLIRFGRPQGSSPIDPPEFTDTGAADAVVVRGTELRLYSDSNLTLNTYVGDDLDRDWEKWSQSFKDMAKHRSEPRWYLRYQARCGCGGAGGLKHTHSGMTGDVFLPDNDWREYQPEGKDPTSYKVSRVMSEFGRAVRFVTSKVEAHDIPEWQPPLFTTPAPRPFPQGIGEIFTFCEEREVHRIITGKLDRNDLSPAERYAVRDSGYRLVALGDGQPGLPEIAYAGFKWCGIFSPLVATKLIRQRRRFGVPRKVVRAKLRRRSSLGPGALRHWDMRNAGGVRRSWGFGSWLHHLIHIEDLVIPGHNRWSDRETYVVRIVPKKADGIYVADHSEYERRREELAVDLRAEKRKNYTQDEIRDFYSARGRTIVEIDKYAGNYKQPIVLVGRELDFDEVEIVSGPWDRERWW